MAKKSKSTALIVRKIAPQVPQAAPRAMTVLQLFDRLYCLYRTLAPGYVASAHCSIRLLDKFLGRTATLADFSGEMFQAFTLWMLTAGQSRRSVNRNLRTLSAMARFAFRRGLIDYRPDVEKLPVEPIRPIAWRPEEFSRLLAAVQEVYGETFWGPLLKAFLLVQYDTGFRTVDVLRIRRADCDLAQGVVHVTEQKTQQRRGFKLHADTLQAAARLGGGGEFLIVYRYKETNPLRKRLRVALERAGLPSTHRDLFQKIRRTTASQAAAAGLDPTSVLGHSARWVTQTYYIDADLLPPQDVAHHLPRPTSAQGVRA